MTLLIRKETNFDYRSYNHKVALLLQTIAVTIIK